MQTFTTTKRIASLAGLLMAGLLVGNQAHAQAGAACNANGTQDERNACAIRDFQQADTAHQILYGDVMRALSAHERPALRKEQSEFSRQRVSHCKRESQPLEAQPDWPSHYHACLLQQIEQRNAVLKRWLHHGPPQ